MRETVKGGINGTILVTGATGKLGSTVIEALVVGDQCEGRHA